MDSDDQKIPVSYALTIEDTEGHSSATFKILRHVSRDEAYDADVPGKEKIRPILTPLKSNNIYPKIHYEIGQRSYVNALSNF